jgi:hypothetical protein
VLEHPLLPDLDGLQLAKPAKPLDRFGVQLNDVQSCLRGLAVPAHVVSQLYLVYDGRVLCLSCRAAICECDPFSFRLAHPQERRYIDLQDSGHAGGVEGDEINACMTKKNTNMSRIGDILSCQLVKAYGRSHISRRGAALSGNRGGDAKARARKGV